MNSLRDETIDFDLKMIRGFALAYFFYGLIYWIQIQEFLVPLPMVYFFVPISGVLMFVRSINWVWSFTFIMIPFIVLKDILYGYYPDVSIVLLLLTLVNWSVWSIQVFIKREKSWRDYLFVISQQFVWLLFFIESPGFQIGITCLILLGATVFVRKVQENSEQKYNARVGLLIQLITVLYLMQKISIIWVS